MTSVGADILQASVGSIASGPAGFGVSYEIVSGGTINGDSVSFDVGLNRQSLDNAKGNLDHGNKDIIKAIEPPKPSSSMSAIMARREKADNKYGALASSAGLAPSALRGLTKYGQQHRHDYRVLNKNPLMRINQRRLQQLRKTFDEISLITKKSVTTRTESVVPKHILAKMVEGALNKNQQTEGVSPTRGKIAGINYGEWARWGHSLIAGSVTPMHGPRPS